MDNKFTENDIRPADLMADQRIAMLTDIGRLLSRRREFARVACPACGGSSAKPWFSKNGFDYVECNACRTFYVNPRPTPEVLEWFYKGSVNYAYWSKAIFPASEEARRDRIAKPRVDRVIGLCDKHGVGRGSLLEVGAGFGTFCEELWKRSAFKRTVAVEPTPDLAEVCRKKGLETVELPIEKLDSKLYGQFDAVVNFEVIEHIFSPDRFVTDLNRLLRPGGLLVLTCPNGLGFDIQMLGPASNTVDHEHLNYFNPASLAGLVEKAGFDVVESFTPGRLDAELVRSKILAGEYDISGQPFLQRVLIDDWILFGDAFQNFLAESGLSSNMWVVAKKRPG